MASNNKDVFRKVAGVLAGAVVVGLTTYALTKVVRRRQQQKGAGGCCGGAGSSCTPAAGKKPRVVFVLGGPGAGKGTQCAHIVSDFGFVHLSAGDLLRDEQKKGGETGNMIKRLIAEGQIVPVAVTLGLLKEAMQENMKRGNFLFLIDGFPRNQDNLDGWNGAMGDFAEVEFCLVLECPEEVMEQRLLKRGETSGRSDDNAAAIKKRFLTYIDSTKPVIATFEQEGKVRLVSAAQSVEEVRQEVKKIFEQVQWQ